ncbi:MAG: DUF4446 family protein [Chloroflexia bacterium]
MDWTILVSFAALALGLVALGWGVWNRRSFRALGLGLGPEAGSLLRRMETVGRRLEALEKRGDALEERLGKFGVWPAVVHYAPLGLGGARHCFVLALLNREGDGVVLNYLAGTGIRLDLKEVRAWRTPGPALTLEEEQAVEAVRQGWEGEQEMPGRRRLR